MATFPQYETKRWQQITGWVFVGLSLALYIAFFIDHNAADQARFEFFRERLRETQINPAVFQALLPKTSWLELLGIIFNPLAIGLLLVGLAWVQNAKKDVGAWAYRVLGVILCGWTILAVAGLILIYTRNLPLSPTVKSRIIVFALVYLLCAILSFYRSHRQTELYRGGPAGKSVAPDPAALAAQRVRPPQPSSFASCNVLQVGPEARRIWQFDARNAAFAFNREHTSRSGQPLPGSLIQKNWTSLWQKKLNVAWLPSESVFVRVANFPASSPEETRAMVELQLEKLSPIPVTQAVWGMHVLPSAAAGAPRSAVDKDAAAAELQTVVVIIVARNVIEEFLGRLEGDGFVADRLELPLLDQLQASTIHEDGAWIYPETAGSRNSALVAWWYGGVLKNVALLSMPPEVTRAAGLKDQLMQMAWAGELEGWLNSAPRWHLVADEAAAAEWVTPLQEGLEQMIDVIPPLPERELAARTAQRAAHTDPNINLLPPEFALRYRQQFVDRLWMRGVLSGLAVYGLYLLGFFVALGVLNYRTKAAESKVAEIGGAYTNALQIRAQFQVLKERQELKYAALDCWEAVAETLPENITLDSMIFGESRNPNGGKMLSLIGSAPNSEMNNLFDFSEKLSRFIVRNQSLFNFKDVPAPKTTSNPGGTSFRWTYELELKRAEGS